MYTKNPKHRDAIPVGTQIVSMLSLFKEPVFATVGSKVTMENGKKGEITREETHDDGSDGKFFVEIDNEPGEKELEFDKVVEAAENKWRKSDNAADTLSRETIELSQPLRKPLPLATKIWFSESLLDTIPKGQRSVGEFANSTPFLVPLPLTAVLATAADNLLLTP